MLRRLDGALADLDLLVDHRLLLDRDLLLAHRQLVLVLVRLHLPSASAGLSFVRAARHQRAGLPIAVLEPTRRQHTRLEHTVTPPLLSLDHAAPEQLAQLVHAC